MFLCIDRLVYRLCLSFHVKDFCVGTVVFLLLCLGQKLIDADRPYDSGNDIPRKQCQRKENVGTTPTQRDEHPQEELRVDVSEHDSKNESRKQPPASLSFTDEQFVHSFQLLERDRLDLEQKQNPKALTRAWVFVEKIQKLVRDFHEEIKASLAPPIFGNVGISPNYESMLVKFYREHDSRKETTVFDILAKYEGRESELFQNLEEKYRAPNPLKAFYGRSASNPPTSYTQLATSRSPMNFSSVTSPIPFGGRSATSAFPRSSTDSHMPNITSNEVGVTAVGIDEMVFLAERLLLQQEKFQKMGKYSHVDIGYHFTKPENLERIRTDGLLNKSERSSRNISSIRNGSQYGEGIYTAEDPQFCSHYGSVGLMVLRLKGESMDADEADRGYDKGNNSITSQERPGMIVLQHGFQCLPVIQFSGEEFTTNQGNLARLKCLQRRVMCLVEELFHRRGVRPTKRVQLPKRRKRFQAQKHAPRSQVIKYRAPDILDEDDPETLFQNVPLRSLNIKDECSICLRTFNNHESSIVRLIRCGHLVHEHCMLHTMAMNNLCPVCRTPITNVVRGKMPSGKMTVTSDPSTHCEGFEKFGTFIIDYAIPAGIQMMYHVEPGQQYPRLHRRAFVPNTLGGIRLLSRLKEAFRRGLTFTVGTSKTNGKKNQVTWSSIPHKTQLNGGLIKFGFPDPTYIQRCNTELDFLGVP